MYEQVDISQKHCAVKQKQKLADRYKQWYIIYVQKLDIPKTSYIFVQVHLYVGNL